MKAKMSTPKIAIKIRPRFKPAPCELEPIEDDLLEFPMLDLRKDAGLTDVKETLNSNILTMIDELITFTVALKAGAQPKDKTALAHKITSFTKARDAIRGYKKEIKTGYQARQEIPGVGEGISKRIDEFLKTGKLQELEKQVDPEAKIIMELCTVTGIGEVKARQLMTNFKVTGVPDLIRKYKAGEIQVAPNQITHHIAIGLAFYEDLQQRMPWSEADQISSIVKTNISLINSRMTVTVCGSYRRKKETCGDIDVLVSHPDIKTEEQMEGHTYLNQIVQQLEKCGLLIGHLTAGSNTKYMGVCRTGANPGRRIDIRFVPYNSMGAAILYFTGSGIFNKLMRFRANQRGYTLNEYGLYHFINEVKGGQVPTPTEQDVFRILRFVYLEPEQRDF